ncbi:MAG: METTL5 family protein [Promethearchaeati archaeon]
MTNKLIFDLGAGTGRLSLSSTFFSPIRIISVDIDDSALKILKQNAIHLQVEKNILPLCTDVRNLQFTPKFLSSSPKITTIMNPPFGVQNPGADRPFLETAFSISDIIYSIHLAHENVHKFIRNFARKNGWHIDYTLPYNMVLEKSFEFHEKKRKHIDVNLYRFKKI